MATVDFVRHRNESLIPSIVPGLVAADQEDRGSSGIECIQDTVWSPGMLHSQLPHVIVPGRLDAGTIRVPERHAVFFEQFHIRADTRLFRSVQMAPPVPELVGELHITCHPVHIMTSMAYAGQVGHASVVCDWSPAGDTLTMAGLEYQARRRNLSLNQVRNRQIPFPGCRGPADASWECRRLRQPTVSSNRMEVGFLSPNTRIEPTPTALFSSNALALPGGSARSSNNHRERLGAERTPRRL